MALGEKSCIVYIGVLIIPRNVFGPRDAKEPARAADYKISSPLLLYATSEKSTIKLISLYDLYNISLL